MHRKYGRSYLSADWVGLLSSFVCDATGRRRRWRRRRRAVAVSEPVVVWASSCRGTGTGQPHHSDLQLARTALCIFFACTSRLFAMPCVSIACCKVVRLCLSTPTRRIAPHPSAAPGSDSVAHWLDRVSAACCRMKPGEANAMACHPSYHG